MPSRRAVGAVMTASGITIIIGSIGGTLAAALAALFGPDGTLVTTSSGTNTDTFVPFSDGDLSSGEDIGPAVGTGQGTIGTGQGEIGTGSTPEPPVVEPGVDYPFPAFDG